jgi:hypothetical protein
MIEGPPFIAPMYHVCVGAEAVSARRFIDLARPWPVAALWRTL